MDHRLDHTFEVSPEHFWRTFLLDEGYERALYEHLRLKIEHKTVRQQGEGQQLIVEREVHLRPERELPVALAKLIRGATLVKERGRFDARAGKLEIEVDLPVIGRLVDFTGCYTWQETGAEVFRRTWQGHCIAKVPLVGRSLERYLLGEIEQSLARAYEFTVRWLAEHPSA